MTRDDRYEEAMKEILLLKEELERLSSPPYTAGTVLQMGDKTVQLVTDSGGLHEVRMPNEKGAGGEIKKKLGPGSKIILNGNGAIVGYSEFSAPVGGEITSVDEVEGERLRVQIKGEPRMVLSKLKDVKVGDEVQLDRFGLIATEKFDRKRTRYALEEVPEAPWSNIGGLEATICQIRSEIEEPFLHRSTFERYGRKPAKGILLYGPPGCGKTMVAKSIAYNLAKLTNNGSGHFISVKGPEILDKWVGNSEANIRRIYAAAREEAERSKIPTVVFIDEAESVMKTRGSGISTDVFDSIVPQFLAEMDGINGNNEVVTVLATNREDIIDPAILRDGRVDRRIRVPRPDRKGAVQIFGIYLKDKPLQGIFKTYKSLAEAAVKRIYDEPRTAYDVVSSKGVLGSFGYQHLVSGAMIKGVVDRGCGFAIQREIEGGKKGLGEEDMSQAIDEEFKESSGFAQALVKDDWEFVFGSKGKGMYDAYRQGYLGLERSDGQNKDHVNTDERRCE